MNKTKENIIQAAIELFNQYGVARVRLQMIADQAGISTGNLAYHFKNKEAIIQAAFGKLTEELKDILARFKTTPDLLDFDMQLDGFYLFDQRNPFFFVHLLDIQRNYPHISPCDMQCIEKILLQIHNRLLFDMRNGLLIPEPFKGFYEQLARTIWMQIAFSSTQRALLREKKHSLLQFKRSVWVLLLPFFTKRGRSRYQALIYPITGLPVE